MTEAGYGTAVYLCTTCDELTVLGREGEGLKPTLTHGGCLKCATPLLDATPYHTRCAVCHEGRTGYLPQHAPRSYGDRGRFCTGCGAFKAYADFWRQASEASGVAPECTACKRA